MDGINIDVIGIEWVKVGHIGDIPKLGARVVRTPGGDIAVFRTGDDAVFALHDRCPQSGGPLSQGIVHGHRVTCPLSNWDIDLASGSAVAPDQGHTGTYPVRIMDGEIRLGLRRSAGNWNG